MSGIVNTRENDMLWIEAEHFSGSNFAARGGNGVKSRAVMDTAQASGGSFVTSFQKPGFWLEYTFREPNDGFWQYRVWLRYATPCPGNTFTLALNGETVARPTAPDSGDWFARFRWVTLGDIEVPKGNHVLRLTLENGAIHPDVIALAPPDSTDMPALLEARAREGESARCLNVRQDDMTRDRLWLQHDRNGVPLGGLGTGKVELCMDGGFANFSINANQDAPIATAPGCFFAIRETRNGAAPVARLLERGRPDLPVIAALDYDGRYPFARIDYRDPALVTQARLEAFSPMIAYNVTDSSVPGALFRFELRNPSESEVRVTLGLSWENLIGCGGLGTKPEYGPGSARRADGQVFWAWNDRTGNDQAESQTTHGRGLRFERNGECPYDASAGEYAVLCACDPDVTVSTTRSYNVERDIPALFRELTERSDVVPPTILGDAGREGKVHPAGIVWAGVSLAAGATRRVTFALGWHFPRVRDRYGVDHGVAYAARFPNAADAAEFLLREADRLAAATREVPDRLAASSLPAWLTTKIVNDQFPLTTCTWFDRAGNFSVNEAPSMMHGCLGTIDQRTASQGVYTDLFHELDRNELSLFARFQHENGQITHDLGHGSVDPARLNFIRWPDLVCSFILQAHRHAHATGDRAFAASIAERIPKAVAWVLSLDDDRDGVPDMGPGRGNTYDSSDWPGCSAFVASLWIAGLHAAADLSRVAGRPADESARYRALAAQAAATMEKRLWNGAFYRNFTGGDATRTDGENCLLPQVAGEWALDLEDLPRGLPEERVRSALSEVYRRNIVGLGARFKGPADETTPAGDTAWAGTAFLQYAWVYFGALAAYRGLTEEAAACWRQAFEQQWTLNAQPWKTRLCGFALNGKFNGLPWYMTNPASWYILKAVSGFAYSRIDGWLRVAPNVPVSWRDDTDGDAAMDIPLFGAGFRMGLAYRDDGTSRRITLAPEKAVGGAALAFGEIRSQLPAGRRAAVQVTVNDTPAKQVVVDAGSGRISVLLQSPWTADKQLDLHIRFVK